MNTGRKIVYFFRNLRSKFRISFRNPHTDREAWYIYLSPLNILTAGLAFVLVVFMIVASLAAFTPIMDYVPGHPANKTRNLLITNNLKLDSLEREVLLWNRYHENIVRIMDGKPPVLAESALPDTVSANPTDIPRVPEDSVLRAQMEGDGPYSLSETASAAARDARTFIEFHTPVQGIVHRKFDPMEGLLGTEIATVGNQPVMAVLEGTVISSSWSAEQGGVVYLLHPGSYISAYLHTGRLMKRAGEKVAAGEAIAFTGGTEEEEGQRGYVQIQLWYNGNPVDPENYLVF